MELKSYSKIIQKGQQNINPVILLFIFFAGFHLQSIAQCPTDLLTGQNLLTNGDFSGGYSNWTFTPDSDGDPNTPVISGVKSPDGYVIFNPPFTQSFSQPGFIYAGTSPNLFNNAFTNFSDHTSTSDNMMLMVDGVCSNGIKLWSQSGIPIKPNTSYYFSVWVHALKDNNSPPGTLQFDINGINLPTTITAPTNLAAGWVQYEAIWNSGSSPVTPGVISVENTTTTGCDQYVDFAIDDVTFIPGCSYAAPGPQPNLGSDRTICGTGGSITLDASVTHNSTTTVTWSDGTTGSGLSAPYTKTITAAGTYSVCVSDNGSCTKSDVVVISNTYSVDLGPDVTLCIPTSVTLDAGYTGPGVTYKWYKSYPTVAPGTSTAQTYYVNVPGTYTVEVTDPVCGVQSDAVVVNTVAAIPNNNTYCTSGVSASLSVTGTGSFKWYDTPTKGTGTLLTTGATYNVPGASIAAPSSYAYYVEDVALTSGSVGKTTINSSGLLDWGVQTTALQMKIHIYQDLQITSLKIPMNNISTSTGTITLEVRDASGNSFSPAKTFVSSSTSITSAQNNTLVQFNFPNLVLDDAWGNDLRLAVSSKTVNGSILWNQGGGPYTYPYASTPANIMDITGSGGTNATNNDYVYFYDIRFSAGPACERVPVTLTYNCPLPVTLVDFHATPQSDKVIVSWVTASEKNNDYFVIERSADGVHFNPVGTQPGHGTSNAVSTYNFVDYNPLEGTSYYRLIQHDLNGDMSYSQMVTVGVADINLSIVPNPTQGVFNVSFNAEEGSDVTLSIYNTLGSPVYSETAHTSSARFSKELHVDFLPNGVYFLHIEKQDQKMIAKVVKE